MLLCFEPDVPTMNSALEQLWRLRQVILHFRSEMTMSGFSSDMADLLILHLGSSRKWQSCPGLGEVIGLEVLVLSGCWGLEELPNLQKLTKLRILDISECNSLSGHPGLGSLVALQELRSLGCKNLKEIPDVSRLTNLLVLDLGGFDTSTYIPGLGNLIAFGEFIACEQLLEHSLRQPGKLTSLHEANISGRPLSSVSASAGRKDDKSNPQELRPVLNLAISGSVVILSLEECLCKTLSGLSNLTALKRRSLSWCNALEKFPDMGNHMRLETLQIS